MARADDTQAIWDACKARGPLTLTEASHAARISRWRAYIAVRAGVAAGTMNWTRVGAYWHVQAIDPLPGGGGGTGGTHTHPHPHEHDHDHTPGHHPGGA